MLIRCPCIPAHASMHAHASQPMLTCMPMHTSPCFAHDHAHAYAYQPMITPMHSIPYNPRGMHVPVQASPCACPCIAAHAHMHAHAYQPILIRMPMHASPCTCACTCIPAHAIMMPAHAYQRMQSMTHAHACAYQPMPVCVFVRLYFNYMCTMNVVVSAPVIPVWAYVVCIHTYPPTSSERYW